MAPVRSFPSPPYRVVQGYYGEYAQDVLSGVSLASPCMISELSHLEAQESLPGLLVFL